MKQTKCLMKITEMNLRNNMLTEKDIGWVNLPQLCLNIRLDSLTHKHALIPLLELSKTAS